MRLQNRVLLLGRRVAITSPWSQASDLLRTGMEMKTMSVSLNSARS